MDIAASGPLVAAIAAFVVVAALLVAVASLFGGRSSDVKRRLDAHIVRVSVDEAKRLERLNVLKAETYSGIPLLDVVLTKIRPARTARVELRQADISLSASQYLLGRLILALALAAGVWLIQGPLFSPLGVVAGLVLPRLFVRHRIRRRKKAFEGQLAEGIELIVGAMRAGHGFLQGLESVTKEMTGPLQAELARVLEQVHVGVNPVEALAEMTDRIDSYDLALFTTAVSIHRKVGGNLAEVLQNIADTVRERRRIRAEVFALTTGPRVSSYVLCAIPVFLLIALSFINSDYRQTMFGTDTGHTMITFCVVWSAIGLFFSQKVAKVDY